MCGIVHQFKILNSFQFYRPKAMPEEFPQEKEWEKDNVQNCFNDEFKHHHGELNKVDKPLTPEMFMENGNQYITDNRAVKYMKKILKNHFCYLTRFSLL